MNPTTESLGALIGRARAWAKAADKSVQLAIRDDALAGMTRDGLVDSDGKYDPRAFSKYATVAAIEALQRAERAGVTP